MNVERKIIGIPLFNLMDQVLSFSTHSRKAIFICGFWRSGTTFLMQSLGQLSHRRTFYEPFHHLSRSFDFQQKEKFWNHKGYGQVYPYWRDIESEEFSKSFNKLLVGRSSSEWVRRHRKLKTSFYPNVLAKFVRSNLMIPYFVQSGIKTIWIIRHPGGVLSSFTRPGSNAAALWQMLSTPQYYKKTLGGQPKLMKEMNSLGMTFDHSNKDAYKNLIDFYFLTHYLPFKEISDSHENLLIMPYEEIVMKPLLAFNRMLNFMDPDKNYTDEMILKAAKKPSGVTKESRINSSEHVKCFGWTNDTSDEMSQYIDRCKEKYKIAGLDDIFARIEKIRNSYV